ncbi:LytTR family DNA-binding domain-containing protein [Sphingosinicella sp. CPCC 101087]|uniref:LytTR family DNA-binding domain-containing protein n=1 Tax=Sphingosinicella sp. CPCC 101087 TaxID=2497754 RepID=UPI00101CDA28|nr:LytTR family DNA-binding domain-containing protein [Sphingosinicella sp. CPCC 101087]
MTSGADTGTSGKGRLPPWALAYAIIAVATMAIGSVNVMSALDQFDWMDRPIDWWKPVVWEATSGVVLLALAWMPMAAIRRFPISRDRRIRDLAAHAALTVPFSIVHVGLMVALRHAAYAAAGEIYEFNDAWLYEYRKDVISYALYAGTYWLSVRLVGSPKPADRRDAETTSDTILIDEGQRVSRVSPDELLAARSCGNYVEFLLGDGRRPLMRTTLGSLGTQLAPLGFVRTHRSWLVNARRVAQMEAEGSGDYGLTLDDGTSVPLSRRYPQALEVLRRGG